MRLNKEWHEANPIQVHPKIEQRIKWHIEHVKNCNCRPIPENLKAAIAKLEMAEK